MSALPPGYTRCPNDAGHIYPSYLPECNVCAELRARGNAVPAAMVNLNTADQPVEESMLPKIAVFAVVAAVIAVGVWGVMRPKADQVADNVAPPQTTPSPEKPPQPNPQSVVRPVPANPVVNAPAPSSSPSEGVGGYMGSDVADKEGAGARNYPVIGKRDLPMPEATRGAFKPQDGDLAGHWEIQRTELGSTVMNIDISPVGDSYSAYVQRGVHNPRPQNLSIREYDGTKLLIQENWAMLGGTDYKFQRVGPQLFEGSALFNGKRLFSVKMVKTFE